MKTPLLLLTLLALASTEFGRGPGSSPEPAAVRVSFESQEQAYRANNEGVARLEQFNPGEAVVAFERALSINPALATARINLAIAHFNSRDLEAAVREARAATRAVPEAPQPFYILGLAARAQQRTDEAETAFRKVLALDPKDVGSLVNLGQLHVQRRRYSEALEVFRRAVAAEPYHATAVYSLGLALVRSGQREEGRSTMARFAELRAGGYGTTFGQNYGEQGRYAEAVASTGAEQDRVDVKTPATRFLARRVAPGSQGTGGRVMLFDYDGDGRLDVFTIGPRGQALYRNQQGRLLDVTRRAGLDPSRGGSGAVAGDYDNDRRLDLFVLRNGAASLHRNDGRQGFNDVTELSGIGKLSARSVTAAFVDVDHDGDLDLFVSGAPGLRKGGSAQPNRLLRNNGDGRFVDVASDAHLADTPTRPVAVVPTDYDNRRDVDLLAVSPHSPAALLRNLRDGTFRDVAAEVGLAAHTAARCAAAADVNKDGYVDFFLCSVTGPDRLVLSNGRGGFNVVPGPVGARGSHTAQFLDYDNDGLLDLLTLTAQGPRLYRNLGKKWADVSAAALPQTKGAAVSLAAGDMDGDGDMDVLLRLANGALHLWDNRSDGRHRSLAVSLAGLVSNRAGVGAKVEIRAGSLWQKLETYAATPAPAPADLIFGLGHRDRADAVRVLWPAGVLQTELNPGSDAGKAPPRAAAKIRIEELDRKPSSCPYLYVWDGSRFAFVTDFMGGGEMGYWSGTAFNVPDADEYVRLPPGRLQPRAGRYELRVTNELEEVLFVDRLALLAVAHPRDIAVHPAEGLVAPPRAFRLFAARDARPPLDAFDEHGHDVLASLEQVDRRYPDDFGVRGIRGYAETHALTLDLGADVPVRALLLLTGWTDYAFSSDNVAAHQAGWTLSPPALQMEDEHGAWHTVIDQVGIPVGRPQTIALELPERWPSASRRVRILTNMRVYWDQILVAESATASLEAIELPLLSAGLRERGFSEPGSPDGREPYLFDYQRASWRSPWKVVPGRYTRTGDVQELITAADDAFVISRPGDEVAVSFDATRLPALPPGWTRTFLFFADGFSKEMDMNSATPDSLPPLPFHGMTRYPYQSPEVFPGGAERADWFERYNTRVVTTPVPSLDLTLLLGQAGSAR